MANNKKFTNKALLNTIHSLDMKLDKYAVGKHRVRLMNMRKGYEKMFYERVQNGTLTRQEKLKIQRERIEKRK